MGIFSNFKFRLLPMLGLALSLAAMPACSKGGGGSGGGGGGGGGGGSASSSGGGSPSPTYSTDKMFFVRNSQGGNTNVLTTPNYKFSSVTVGSGDGRIRASSANYIMKGSVNETLQ